MMRVIISGTRQDVFDYYCRMSPDLACYARCGAFVFLPKSGQIIGGNRVCRAMVDLAFGKPEFCDNIMSGMSHGV